MAIPPTFKFEIKSANPANFTLNSVISSPRMCTPLDLSAACANIVLESNDEQIPGIIRACAEYPFTDFFAFAHRTGLYNRQKILWESIGRVTSVEVFRLQQGLFSKTDLPWLDFFFLDGRGRVLFMAHLVEPQARNQNLHEDRQLKDHMRDLVHRAEKVSAAKGPLTGLFLFFTAEFPKIVLSKVQELTGSSDPIGRYESLLPPPLTCPFDLVEIGVAARANSVDGNSRFDYRLLQPDLGAKASVRTSHTNLASMDSTPPED